MTHLLRSFRGAVLSLTEQMLVVLNPSSNYRQQSYFACEGDTYLDTMFLLCTFHLVSSLADVKVAPQNTGAGDASVLMVRNPAWCVKSYRGIVHLHSSNDVCFVFVHTRSF